MTRKRTSQLEATPTVVTPNPAVALRVRAVRVVCAVLAFVTGFSGALAAKAQSVDPNAPPVVGDYYAGLGCIASMEGRSAQVDGDGNYSIPNVPAVQGKYKVHVVCPQPDGTLLDGYSEFYALSGVPDIEVPLLPLDVPRPQPGALRVIQFSGDLSAVGATSQLSTVATLTDGNLVDKTLGSSGTTYISSNPAVATVSVDGLVTATGPGSLTITANNNGLVATVMLNSFASLDSDGDGMPDAWELANGLNPYDPTDAGLDPDGDGLTNLQEYLLGTNPHVYDTDGDGLSDGQEVALGTNPLVADTDGDGLSDGQEVALGTNPLVADTDGDGIPDGVEVKIGTNPLVADATTTVTGYVTNPDGTPSVGTSAVLLTYFTTVTDTTGSFTIPHVPTSLGNVIASAEEVIAGKVYSGSSKPTTPVANAITNVGTISLGQNAGQVSGTVTTPDNVPDAGVQVVVTGGVDTRSAVTGATGLYAVSGLEAGPVSVSAFDPVTSLRALGTGILSGGAGLVVNLKLAPFGTVSGVVSDVSGHAVGAGVSVTIGGALSASTTTDGLGHYSFSFVPLGGVVTDATDSNGNHGQTKASVTATAQTLVANIQYLGRGTVNGTVSDGTGAAVAGATVSLSNAGTLYQGLTTTTNSIGQYTFANVFIGTINLSATSTLNSLGGTATTTITANAQTVVANISLSPTATIAGTVFRSDGATAVSNAAVTVLGTALTATTSATGTYSISNVPLNSYTVMASDPASNDRGQANVALPTAGQTVARNINMVGLGTVKVTVNDGGGNPNAGAAVQMSTGAPFSLNFSGVTGSDGTVSFTQVVAGSLSISATNPSTNLSGSANATFAANATTNVTVTLQSAGTVQGTVFKSDGQTPVAGITVQVPYGNTTFSTITSSTGSYSITNVPSGTRQVEVVDSVGNTLSFNNNIVISSQGQVVTANFVIVGRGTISGVVTNPDGSAAPGVSVQILSGLSGSQYLYGTSTDINGSYSIALVPIGTYNVTAQQHTLTTNSYGTASGNLPSDGATSIANIVLSSTLVPSVLELEDANQFQYPIRENGAIFSGSFGVFNGDGSANQAASLLSLVQNGKTIPFTGAALAPVDLGGREISITQNNIAGLNVTRRVFVPSDGYFARYIELISNPGATDITVGVQLATNFRQVQQDIKINGATYQTTNVPQILLTSSGDQVVNLADPNNPDHWLTFGGALDQDPYTPDQFNENPIPSIADVFDGPGGSLAPSALTYAQDSSGAFSLLTESYSNLKIPAGGTVGILHFLSQENLNEGAAAAATRLGQLPPEALAGISNVDLGAIRNFAVPAGGASAVAALPTLTNQVNGHVYGSDGTTIIPGAIVHLQSTNQIFGRTYFANADGNGYYSFQGGVNSVVVPLQPFNVLSFEPQTTTVLTPNCAQFGNFVGSGCAIVSPTFAGSFTGSASTALQDIVFNNTGTVTGIVSRGPTVLNVAGTVTLSGGPMSSITVPIQADGSYTIPGVLQGTYIIQASVTNTLLTGLTSTTVATGQTTTTNITIIESGNITGSVTRPDGSLAIGDTVNLRIAGLNTVTVTVDTSGHYAFTDVPIGPASVDCFDSFSNTAANATVSVTGNATVTQNLALQSAGSVVGTVSVNDGSSLANLTVTLTGTTTTGTQNLSTTTNSTGQFTFNNVMPATIVLRVTNNEGLQGTGNGSLPLAGQTATINIALIAAGNLQGTVFQGDGSTPAAGIKMTLSPAPLTGSATTTTNASGAYSYANVALGNFTVYASNATTGDQATASGQIQAINQQRTINLTLNGFGNLSVKVLGTGGTGVPGASVVVTTQNIRTTNTATTDGTGTAQFTNIFAGPFTVVARDPVSGYSVNGSGNVTYNGNTSMTLALQALATLQGIVYSPDGTTPAAGITVQIAGQVSRSTTTASDGSYQFASIPTGYYNISAQDASGTTRAYANSLQLQTSGSTVTQNLTLVGIGSVSGTVLNQDGSVAENVSLTLTSANTSFGGARNTTAGGDGTYSFSEVPVGKFTVSVNNLPTGVIGYGNGSIAANLGTAVVNIQIQGNAITLPVTLLDADGFNYQILGNGEYYGDGYNGGFTPFAGAQPLVLTVGGTSSQFGYSTAAAAIQSLSGQQIELTIPMNGLNVTRKIYVPTNGYFARRLDVLQNPTSSPITVTVALGALGNYDREVKNRLPQIVTTSNGNKTIDKTILWDVDDDDSGTAPYPQTQPAVAVVFEGAAAPTALANAANSINSYTTGYGGNGSNIYSEGYESWIYTYQPVTIAGNSQVSFLSFTAQEATQGTAETAAQRLVQLPPEALAGLSTADLASVVNFVIPTTQTLAPVAPPPTATLLGHVYAYDSTTPIPNAKVYAQSTDLQYGGGATIAADTLGAYSLPAFAFDTYAVQAIDPIDGSPSPLATGTLASGATTQVQDIPFTGTGILQGLIQTTGQTMISSGVASAFFCAGPNNTGCGYGNAPISTAGAFTFLTIPQSNVNLSVNVYTSSLGGFYLQQNDYIPGNQTTSVTLQLPPTGNVSGVVTNADNTPAAGASVAASPATNGTYESTKTASDGSFAFTGIGLASYTILATDPITGNVVSKTVNVTQDSSSTVNLQFIGKGTVNLTLKYANGNIGQNAVVYIFVATGSQTNPYATCNTDTNGQCSFANVPDGAFTLHAFYPGQTFYSTTTGTMTGNAQTVAIAATLTPVGTISGTVVYANNTPASGDYVSAKDHTNAYAGYGITDSAGNYAISPVPADRPIDVYSYNTTNNSTNRTIEATANNQQVGGDGQTLTVNLRYPGLATVHATALQKNGTPYTSGTIYISSTDGTQSYSAGVGSDGSATFTNVVEGNFIASFRSGYTNFNNGSTTFAVPPSADGTTVQVNIQTSPAGTVQGQIFAADGTTLITGADVRITLKDSLTGSTTSTDTTSGSYSFTNVQESSTGFSITAQDEGITTGAQTANATITTDGQVITQNFTLPVSAVNGTVYLYDGVTPVPYANIRGAQTINGSTNYIYASDADANGNFQIVGAVTGPLTITANDQNSVNGSANVTLSTDTSILTATKVNLGAVGTIMGTVYDANGAISDFADVDIASSGNNGGFSAYAGSDVNGNYTISDVPIGNITVNAYLPNNVTETATGVLNNNGDVVTINVGSVPVAPSGLIFGTVYDDNQNPSPGATVTATPASSGQPVNAVTDTNGVYAFSGLPLGDVTVTAVLSDGVTTEGPTTGTIVAVNTPVEIDLGLQNPGYISGVASDADGNPLANATLYVGNDNENSNYSLSTDGNGYYLLNGPGPGPITVQLISSTQNPDGSYDVLATAKGTLPYGGNVTINIALPSTTGQTMKMQIGQPSRPGVLLATKQHPAINTQTATAARKPHTTAVSLNPAPVRTNQKTFSVTRNTHAAQPPMVDALHAEGAIR